MQKPPHGEGGEPGEHFTYFMVRTQSRGRESPGPLSGMVERLGSGRKERFSGADELLRLLTDWSDATLMMGAEDPAGNERGPNETRRMRP